MTGIYMIINKIDGKKYYGSAKNIRIRWNRHINDLNKNQHQNIILQRAWNKYGSENFEFEVLEECSYDDLLIIEQKYLDRNPEYNIGKKSSGGDNISKNPNKDKIIKNIKNGLKVRYSKLTESEKETRSRNLLGEKNPNWRGGSSKKYCKCGKEISPKNKTCMSCRDTKGEKNPSYGKVITEDRKEYLSKLFKGKCLHNNTKEITINDIDYLSFKDAESILGINWNTIRHRILSKNPKYKTYNYKGEEKISYTKEEQSKRISKSQIGKYRKFNKCIIIDDVEYRTLKDASEKLNIHPMTIKGRLLNEKFQNYKYKFQILSLDERIEMIMKEPLFDILEFGVGNQVTEKHCHKICDLYNIPREKINNVKK